MTDSNFEKLFREVKTRLDELERKINEINKQTIPWPTQPFEMQSTCSKCGIALGKAMVYVCYDSDCPTFPRPTCDIALLSDKS